MEHRPIIISGGGICGLAAALGAAQAGFSAVVIERSQAFDEIGAGLQIGPNAVRALRHLGAWPYVEPIIRAPSALTLLRADTDRIVRQHSLGATFEARFGAPYRVAHRADLHMALRQAVAEMPGITVHMGDEISGTRESHDAIQVQTVRGLDLHGHLLVLADGVHSRLRQALVPQSKPRSVGYDLHRSLLAHDGSEDDAVTVWMGSGFHCVRYTVGNPARTNVVWTTPRGKRPTDYLVDMSPTLRRLAAQCDGSTVWPALVVDPLPQWQFGRTVLLGDAAHATVPFLAQGAAMALEDAAWLMAALRNGGPMVGDEASRRMRTARLHGASLRQARVYHAGRVAGHMRDAVLRFMPESVFWQQMDWLYRHDETRPRTA